MIIARFLVSGALGFSLLGLVMYMLTGDKRFQRAALLVLKWTLFASLGFFAVLIGLNLSETAT